MHLTEPILENAEFSNKIRLIKTTNAKYSPY